MVVKFRFDNYRSVEEISKNFGNSCVCVLGSPFEDELEFISFDQGGSEIALFNAQFRQLSAGINWSREQFEAAFYLSKLSVHYVITLDRHLPCWNLLKP